MEYLRISYEISERRACAVLKTPRSSQRYKSVATPQEELRIKLRDLAFSRPGYGYRRLHILLGREGWQVNHKRVYRLYRQEGLILRKKPPKHRVSAKKRGDTPLPSALNQTWAMDFLSDQLYNGTYIRILAVIDVFSRFCLALLAGRHFRGDEVTAALESLRKRHGTPKSIRVDNGTEFTSKVVDQWAYWNKVELDFSRPGRPTDNAFIESFNGRFRAECLNQHWFLSIHDAQRKCDEWRLDYNRNRPHSALGDVSPEEFLAARGGPGSATLRQDLHGQVH